MTWRAATAAVALLGSAAATAATTGFAEVRAAHRPSDITLLDRHGEPLQVLRVDTARRALPWVPLADMSPALRHAMLVSEDRRFWDHAGVDWAALAAGAWARAWDGRTRGASTLTMQLAALLDGDLARPEGGRGVTAKLGQVSAAQWLDARWKKTEILEAWLNLVPLRGEAVGVPAAAWAMFGKQPGGLDRTESALLAALVRAPNAEPRRLLQRACGVLRAIGEGCGRLELVAPAALARRAGAAPGPQLAPHAARAWWATLPNARREQLMREPQRARTTLDARLQRVALAALRRQLAELQGRNVGDAALVVLDNASGEVRAWVGSTGEGAAASVVDHVLARRQPGSTIKPFVYALAFDAGLLGPDTLLDDAPLQLPAGGEALFVPQNYDHRHHGRVPARVALASSLNVPTVRVAAMFGPDVLFERLQRAGLKLEHGAGFHGHALALGSAEVRLLDLAQAYRLLANGGPPAFGAAAVREVAAILADPAARATTFGFDSVLATRRWAAVKTGTSKDMRDNWCLGWDRRHTVGVWLGNSGGEPMHGVSGTTGAAPAWAEVVRWLQSGEPPVPPVVDTTVANTRAPIAPAVGRFGIHSPREGSVIALDPEIPNAAQRLVIAGAAAARWELRRRDGQRIVLGRGERFAWLPQPGRWTLERRSAEGRVLDQVRFEVRLPPRLVAGAAASHERAR
jgi:penicillin-binding protein 1C